MRDTGSVKLRTTKGLLWFVLGFALTVWVARFLAGLGTVTNLSDKTPWGLWIGFDVLGGVALAAGGFVIAAVVYVFRQERFRPLLRPAILTAFLGYMAVACGLLFDIGRPWNIWRPMFFWQHHSALFEVAWCVMLYLTVLALEFAPVPLEGSRFHGIAKALKSASLPLVILGIMLSTLHQSSLGTLFLIAPARVHPLWYTPLLPLLFFVSAVGLGLAMVMFESKATAWLYDRKQEDHVLKKLGLPLACVLLLYTAIRIGDLAARGQLTHLFAGTRESWLFVFEIGISALVPATWILLSRGSISGRGLFACAGFVVFGFVMHRIDVGGVSGVGLTDTGYFPSWQEIATSAGVVAGAVLLFFFLIERFRVYEAQPGDEVAALRPSRYALRAPLVAFRAFSGLFVLGVALSFAFLPGGALAGPRPEETPVRGTRRVLAESVAFETTGGTRLQFAGITGTVDETKREVLLIDGNRTGPLSLFDHDAHVERQGGRASCAICHHMSRPADRETSCYECHRDQYLPTDLFDHGFHGSANGGNSGCSECHTDPNARKTRENVTACLECHQDMVAEHERALVEKPGAKSRFLAASYMDAMHGTCLKCHEAQDAEDGAEVPRLALCGTCHAEALDLTPGRKE